MEDPLDATGKCEFCKVRASEHSTMNVDSPDMMRSCAPATRATRG